jgi:hypothetical protein
MPELALVKKNFTDKEKKLLSELTNPGAEISVIAPAEMDAKDWLFATDVTCKALVRAQVQEQALIPVLGSLLSIARKNPEMVKQAGFEGFDDLIEKHIEPTYGISRSSAYEFMGIVSKWGALLPNVQSYEAIPRRNFRVLKAAVPAGDEGKKFAKDLVEKAKELGEKALKAFCVEKKYIEQGEADGAIFKVPCNKSEFKRLTAFIENPDYQAYVGSGKAARMLLKAIAEATTEWTAQIEEQEPEVPSEAAS